jgi:hypothetical protein
METPTPQAPNHPSRQAKRMLACCEKSGRVREAFARRGWDAWSCDFQPSDIPGQHIQDDCLNHLRDGWDLMIAFPPCTYLCTSGARWLYDPRFPTRMADREKAVEFVLTLWNSGIPQISLENPIGHLSRVLGKPTQIIQPYWFGEDASKATCLWLKNLSPLRPTNMIKPSTVSVDGGKTWNKWFFETSRGRGAQRSNTRSLTFQGVADAMAEQWGCLSPNRERSPTESVFQAELQFS